MVMVKVVGGDAGGEMTVMVVLKNRNMNKEQQTVTATYISIIGIVWGE